MWQASGTRSARQFRQRSCFPPRKSKTIKISRREGMRRALKIVSVGCMEFSRSDFGKPYRDRLDMREFHGWSSQALFRVDPHALPYLHYSGFFGAFSAPLAFQVNISTKKTFFVSSRPR